MSLRENGGYAVVVGGVNLDIGGIPFEPLLGRDSNPGRVRVAVGGVGQNIARNLALLRVPVHFLTAFGWDEAGERVVRTCESAGISLSSALRLRDASTSVYLYIADEMGEMQLAVSDMAVCGRITPEYLAQHEQLLNGAGAVVLDTNLPQESIQWLADHCTAPLFADPVSMAKADKLLPVLGRLHTLKPNRLEAEALCGLPITDKESALRAADALLATGLQRVFLSLGPHGVLAVEGIERLFLPNPPLQKRENASGCGDAFMAALAWAFLQGADLRRSALCGLTAAAVTMERAETVNPGMSAGMIQSKMELI